MQHENQELITQNVTSFYLCILTIDGSELERELHETLWPQLNTFLLGCSFGACRQHSWCYLSCLTDNYKVTAPEFICNQHPTVSSVYCNFIIHVTL